MYFFGLQAHFWRFLSIWVLYSIANSWGKNIHFLQVRLINIRLILVFMLYSIISGIKEAVESSDTKVYIAVFLLFIFIYIQLNKLSLFLD